jgi:transposase-like protein
MDERLRFVARLLEGEEMSALCREFGISRKTGYRIWGRYKDEGLEALTDRSRRPERYGNQLPAQVEAMIRTGGRAKSASCLYAACRTRCGFRPTAPSMPCWTVTVSSNTKEGAGAGRTARRCQPG